LSPTVVPVLERHAEMDFLIWPIISGGAYLLVAAAPADMRAKVPPMVLHWIPFRRGVRRDLDGAGGGGGGAAGALGEPIRCTCLATRRSCSALLAPTAMDDARDLILRLAIRASKPNTSVA